MINFSFLELKKLEYFFVLKIEINAKTVAKIINGSITNIITDVPLGSNCGRGKNTLIIETKHTIDMIKQQLVNDNILFHLIFLSRFFFCIFSNVLQR